jgi:hypothetical protein
MESEWLNTGNFWRTDDCPQIGFTNPEWTIHHLSYSITSQQTLLHLKHNVFLCQRYVILIHSLHFCKSMNCLTLWIVCVCLSARHNCPKEYLPVIRVTPMLSVATGVPCLSLIIGFFFPLIYPIDLISRAFTRSRFGHPDQVERLVKRPLFRSTNL